MSRASVDFKTAWANRDLSVQTLFNTINNWLMQNHNYAKYNTAYFEHLEAQWMEYAKLTDKQIAILKDIVERFIMVDHEPKNNN